MIESDSSRVLPKFEFYLLSKRYQDEPEIDVYLGKLNPLGFDKRDGSNSKYYSQHNTSDT
jgi:hypothetical protein